MNSKVISIVVLVVLAGIGLFAWRSYGGLNSRVNSQAANIYNVTGDPLGEELTFSEAITWQTLGGTQCLGLNSRGQALIGATYRKSFSFSRGCTIVNTEVSTPIGSNIPDSQRFWFGGLVGNQCFSVVRDTSGNASVVFLEQDIKDKDTCLIN